MTLRARLAAWWGRHIVGDIPPGCEDLAISNLDRLDPTWSTR